MEEEDLLRRRRAELISIKEISPEIILNDLGIPYRKMTGYYECRAIWRGDRNPSMSVFQDGSLWRWKDHGTGAGGTWIDLYMVMKNMTYLEAVKYLRERFLNGASVEEKLYDDYYGEEREVFVKESDYTEWHVTQLEEREVGSETKAYLGIYRKIRHVPDWIRDVRYRLVNAITGEVKNRRAFGVKDVAGNWHVRYTYEAKVKERVLRMNDEEGSSYSLIEKSGEQICIVEGFIDALRIDELLPQTDILILNGIENWKKPIDVINDYNKVYLCLDNDKPGRHTEEKLLQNINARDIIRLTFNAKDIDEAVRNKEIIQLKKINRHHMRLDR